MTYSLREPSPIASFDAADHAGDVVLVIMGGYHDQFPTREHGVKACARVSIVVLTGRSAETIYEDVLLFSKIGSQFREMDSGDVSLARIVKNGRSISFDPGSKYDESFATQWINDNSRRFEQLRRDAQRNYQDQLENVAERLRASGVKAEPEPQFERPDSSRPGATLDSPREPSTETTEEETGY